MKKPRPMGAAGAVDKRCYPPKKNNAERRFFFDHVGAKRKAHFASQSCKKKAPIRGFRRLRTATRAPRPRLRRLPQKAGENFHCFVYSLTKRNGHRFCGVRSVWSYSRPDCVYFASNQVSPAWISTVSGTASRAAFSISSRRITIAFSAQSRFASISSSS